MANEDEKLDQEKEIHKLPEIEGQFDFRPSYVLGKDGPLAKDLPDYQVRPSQITLAEHIQKAFQEKECLMGEAGTGTGKSFACLLAAFETSIGTRMPVIISTHTIALQEQLCDKDVPFMLKKLGLNINVALAKGRGNYVSIRRANLAIKDKVQDYTKLEQWLKTTKDGTVTSMQFKPEPQTWGRAKSDSDNCLGEKCSTFNQCFYQQSRRRLNEAHVIITNHNLVLLDLKMKASGLKGALPEFRHLIFDEAHEVENVARKVFTFELNQRELHNVFYEIANDKTNGFLDNMLAPAQAELRDSMANKTENPVADAIGKAYKAIETLLKENDKFFKAVGNYVGGAAMKRFTEKGAIKTDILENLKEVLSCLKSLSAHLIEKDHKILLDYAAKRCSEIATGIDQLLTLPNVDGKDYPEIVAWASVRHGPSMTKSYSISCAPIFLKQTMKRLVFSKLDSVVFTSATLATGGKNPFHMIESALGLENPMRLRLPAAFDYSKQASIVIIEDVPEQSSSNYVPVLAEQVKKYVKATNGGAFVLFTSFKVMNEVYNLVKINLELAGLTLFCQGQKLNRNQMIEQFKGTYKGALFGVSSFWTGIDIPGKALRNLIITKLPFPAPDDPLMEAQSQIYEKFGRNFFQERAVPMTATMLKQGFGRLIRKNTDKGIVVILDSRIVTKKYGSMLLQALPSNCPIRRARLDTRLGSS